MASFRETRELLLLAHSEHHLSDEDFSLLYDINTSHNLHFPYWQYSSFGLEDMTEAECWAEFRFYKNDVIHLAEILQIPNEIHCTNRTKCDRIEALCIMLKRFSYPCRYGDMIPRFGRSVPELSQISNHMLNFVYNNYSNKLTDLNQNWLTPNNLQDYAFAIHNKGAPLQNCWTFVDGTARPICRPGE